MGYFEQEKEIMENEEVKVESEDLLTYEVFFTDGTEVVVLGFKRLVNEKDQKIYIWSDPTDRRKQTVIPLANVLYWSVK